MKIQLPLTEKIISRLKPGDELELSGIIYTARDIAHKKLVKLIAEKKPLPISIKNQTFYYCGPTPAKPGQVIGSCGPTTSARMDVFTSTLLKSGLKGMIGKGLRSGTVIKSIKANHCVYFTAYAGAGAYLNQFVKKARTVAFKEYGTEAIQELTVANFPVVVANN